MLLKADATSTGTLLRYLNERDSCGRTALHYASDENNDLRNIVEERSTSLMLVPGVIIHHSVPNDAMSKA
jgi:hypothetical protein